MTNKNNSILLCSQDSLLTKSLYGLLRDSGYQVETREHAAESIKCVLEKHYLAVILDSRDVGLSVFEAAAIIKSLNPDIYIFFIGGHEDATDICSVKKPEDIDQLVEFINELSVLKLQAAW